MRSFEERLAEIQRRSEAILKERKQKRRRALLVCVPLLLCISLWGVHSLNGNSATEAEYVPFDEEVSLEETVPASFTECALENELSHVQRVCVSAEDWELCHEGQKEIRSITELLTELCSVDDSEWVSATTALSGMEGSKSYSIVLYTQEGQAVIYRLEQRLLINEDKERCVLLTKKQETELKNLLGIPET